MTFSIVCADPATGEIGASRPSLGPAALLPASGCVARPKALPFSLIPASPADLAEAVCYALRFKETGKPLGVRMRDDPALMAQRIVRHLERFGFVVMRRPTIKPHSVG